MIWIKGAVAAISGVLAYLWGAWDALIIALIVCVAADYVTGIIKAAVNGELSSGVGWRGLLKKVLIFVLVAVATVVDNLVPATNGALRTAVIAFYVANEGLSILENAGALGLPMPAKLRNALAKLRDDNDK